MGYPILDAVGVEIEFEHMLQSDVRQEFGDRWRYDHDASCETPGGYVGVSQPSSQGRNSIPYEAAPEFIAAQNGGRGSVIGSEVVLSSPISILEERNILEQELRRAAQVLSKYGEYASPRCGFHIHISMPLYLPGQKNILRLAAFLEQVFFTIAGQGGTFRGVLKNESLYCRPITKWGPQCVKNNYDGYNQIFNLGNLLSSTTQRQFWWRYGNLSMGNVDRYHQSRYVWCNLYALLAHGSIENRIFNLTLSPHVMLAEILLWLDFAKTAMNTPERKLECLPVNSIFDPASKEKILRDFETFLSLLQDPSMSEKQMELIRQLILCGETPKITPIYVKSHYRPDSQFDFSSEEGGNLSNISGAIQTVQVDDVHVRSGRRRS